MAKLARVRDYRTGSNHVADLHAFATERPRKVTDCMERGSFWTVNLIRDGHLPTMTVDYGMGTAHRAPPTCDDVLASLCSDAAGYDGARTFEDWCSEYGYDTDSRKAEAIYRAVGEQAKALRYLLGADYERIVALGSREWQAD